MPVRAGKAILALAVALLLVAAGAASASAVTVLRGGGNLLDVRLRLDEAGVPLRFEVEEDWIRCPNSLAPMDDREFAELDLATPERLQDAGTFTERSSGFRYAVRYRIEARRIGADRWEGIYRTNAKVFFRGSKVMVCQRKDRRAVWHVGGGS